MNDTAYVIMPVYNEESVVREVVDGLSLYFSNIVCIDDGSTDGSAAEIAKTNAVLLQHTTNMGQGAALRTGIQYALRDKRSQYFVTFDADGQHRVSDALKMLKTLKRTNNDIILGSRFLGEAEDISLSKKIILKLAIAFTNKTTGVRLTDTHNGLRVFNRRFAESARIRCKGMAHASELIYRIAEGKFSYVELPVVISYSDYTRSKRSTIAHIFDVLGELRKVRKELADQTE